MFEDRLLFKGKTIPTGNDITSFRNLQWHQLSDRQKDDLTDYIFELIPMVNKDWNKVVLKAVPRKLIIGMDVFRSKVNAGDEAYIIKVINHYRGLWMTAVEGNGLSGGQAVKGLKQIAVDMALEADPKTDLNTVDMKHWYRLAKEARKKGGQKKGPKEGLKNLCTEREDYNDKVFESKTWLANDDFNETLKELQMRYYGLNDKSPVESFVEADTTAQQPRKKKKIVAIALA